jgi:hypothetical protein
VLFVKRARYRNGFSKQDDRRGVEEASALLAALP